MAFGLHKQELKSGGPRKAFPTLPSGKYDAILSAIIDLEFQVTEYEGEESVVHQVKLLYEVPELMVESEDGTEYPLILGQTVTLSANTRSKFYKIVNALTQANLTDKQVLSMINEEDGSLKDLLGKACTLKVNEYETKQKDEDGKTIKRNGIKEVLELDSRVPQPKGARETFIFVVTAKPNISTFKEKLTSWTQDTIMKAVNADEYPKELHKAYMEVQEQRAADKERKV